MNVYASATEGWGGGANQSGDQVLSSGTVTIDCPDVGQQLTDMPSAVKPAVDKELAALDKQITEAYTRLASTRQAQTDDPGYVQNAILGPLKEQRTAVIDRIKTAYQGSGATAPSSIDGLAPCTGVAADPGQTAAAGGGQGGNDGQSGGGQNGDGAQGGGQQQGNGGQGTGQQGGGQAASGPVASDFVDIRSVQPNARKPAGQADASTGSFVTKCGVNANKNHNTDNVIVAPGVKNGAHHLHDYVGNQSNDAFADNNTFAAARTSCQNQDDKSSYYWPVLRVQDGTQDFDQNNDGGGKEGNVGRILVAKQAEIAFVGSPTSKVVAMPRFLRIITGDAKAFTNGPANANAHWSCTGFEDRQLTEKYPICPQGSQVVRSFAFQSCWDGQNIDSANHRTHVAFADASGTCQNGFKAIPQLTMRLVYDTPQPVIENGQVKNAYAVDGFPEQLHKPVTDHDDFINVMTDGLMNQVVDCINSGRQCGGDTGGQPQDTPSPSASPSSGGNGGNGGNGGSAPGTGSGGNAGGGQGSASGGDAGGAPGTPSGGGQGGTGPGASTGGEQTASPSAGAQDTATPGAGSGGDQGGEAPRVYASQSAAQGDAAGAAQSGSGGSGQGSIGEAAQPGRAPTAGGYAPSAPPQTEPQAVSGGLADTGAHLWPAAAGALLVIAGLVVLRRMARRPY